MILLADGTLLTCPACQLQMVRSRNSCSEITTLADLGFGDPGFQGGRAITPHLDEMAHGSHSFVFNRFYCGDVLSITHLSSRPDQSRMSYRRCRVLADSRQYSHRPNTEQV